MNMVIELYSYHTTLILLQILILGIDLYQLRGILPNDRHAKRYHYNAWCYFSRNFNQISLINQPSIFIKYLYQVHTTSSSYHIKSIPIDMFLKIHSQMVTRRKRIVSSRIVQLTKWTPFLNTGVQGVFYYTCGELPKWVFVTFHFRGRTQHTSFCGVVCARY